MSDIQNKPQDLAPAAAPEAAGNANFATIMGAVAGLSGCVGAALARENAKELTVPAEIACGAASVLRDYVQHKPVEAAIIAVIGGAGAVAAKAVVEKVAASPVGLVADAAVGQAKQNAAAEANDLGQKLRANPASPSGVVIGKVGELAVRGAQAEGAAAEHTSNQILDAVKSIPAKAREFEQKRPVTSAVIDVGVAQATGIMSFTGINKVIATEIKGAAQITHEGLDSALKLIGLR